MITTPVVFIVFNRKDTAQEVFNAIRKAKPKKLYVIADGPRPDVENEAGRCRETRRIIDQVDWNCTVKKIFAKNNMGCGERISSGLDWVFKKEEQAIILEDDCVPAQSFFPYCEDLLIRYKDDTRIMHINGTNFTPERKRNDDSYFFSKFVHIWGWATWRRAWKHYDYSMKLWPGMRDENWLIDLFGSSKAALYWTHYLDLCHQHKIIPSTWDYQWFFTVWSNSGLCITPRKNMVSNIGLSGVHMDYKTGDPGTTMFFNELAEDFTIIQYPKFIIANRWYDIYHFRHHFFVSIRKRIKRKIWRLLH